MKKDLKIVVGFFISLLIGMTLIAGVLGYRNANLKSEISQQDHIINNLSQQNAKMVELICAYEKVLTGTPSELCVEG